MEQRVIDYFNGSIEATLNAGESLVDPIVASATLMAESLLNGVRIFSCGNGISATLASTFSYILMNQYRIERPSFSAFCLSSDPVVSTGITHQANFTELYRRQLRALAQDGDILVLFSANSNASNLIQAVQTAHEKEMGIIAFTGSGDHDISAMLTNTDLELHVDHPDLYRVHQTQLLCQLCICELIEFQLFGD